MRLQSRGGSHHQNKVLCRVQIPQGLILAGTRFPEEMGSRSGFTIQTGLTFELPRPLAESDPLLRLYNRLSPRSDYLTISANGTVYSTTADYIPAQTYARQIHFSQTSRIFELPAHHLIRREHRGGPWYVEEEVSDPDERRPDERRPDE